MSHSAIARDTRLSLQARAIAFWILDNPSEAINPDAIAEANNMTVRQVKMYLSELAKYGYLSRPEKYRDAHGHFAYTPYTLKPETVSAEPPPTVDTPTVCGENVHGRDTALPYAVKTFTDGNGEMAKIAADSAQNTVTEAIEPETVSAEPPEPPAPEASKPARIRGRDAATRVNILSLKAKDKGKRQKQKAKDKNISPTGESVLPEISDSPVQVNHREMHAAVCDAFKVNPGGFVGRLAQQLLGTAPDGKRREYAIAPAMTAVEVVAFGQWYREVFGVTVKVPTTAETLQERVMQFRDDTTRHAKKMAVAEQRLARLMQEKTRQDVSPRNIPASPPVEREGTLKSGDMAPVQEWEVAGYVKAGLMTADEQPRPTMTMIYDRLAQRMGSNNNATRTE